MSVSDQTKEDVYDIAGIAAVIQRQEAKKVALQFPDSMLCDAEYVTSAIQKQVDSDVDLYILGDTTVCPCCVDTVAIEHVHADLVVHFGDACMSVVKDIPVYYAFERCPLDIDCLVEAVRSRYGGSAKTLYLAYDLAFAHCSDKMEEAIRAVCPHVVCGKVKHSQNLKEDETVAEDCVKVGTMYFPGKELSTEGILLFVGKDGIVTSNVSENGNLYSILLDSGYSQAAVYSDYEIKMVNANKFLMQRYVNIERFESLNVIGIVVGTLSVNRYNEMVSKLMRLAEQHDQVAYPFLVGKLNVPKLANFPGIEGFVLIGCERSCFIDTHEYPFPIVTPYEYEISLKEREWEAVYIHDYVKLLGEEAEEEAEAEEWSVREEENQIIAFQSTALDYVNQQHYHGLEQTGDVSTPAVLKKGKKGIASCYEKELF